ncbi:dockerin type I domain-containing protein [Pseudobacteroides cellulosolvens]|uniref:Uncharacterized protein n=1 Tax=Pseudobacteroides cellulosolvens ATCC 35603 = DSM 2933 TaxID=398512 RepID=A0A0L6JVP6_9FIRM|nr:dockerin type I domain-containing protein [Pseudobacteroides cellulosolvens]KNY29941.1 hypothetical protein Bccel_5218 [Pseudobacteroides cellulosolvens ATCC 35603 = DSM 2933]
MFPKTKTRFYMSTVLIILLVSINFIQSFAQSPSPTPLSNPYPAGVYDMECYIKPDLTENTPAVFEDFEITLEYKGSTFQGKTDENGYLKLLSVYTLPWNVTISKPGFLTKTYKSQNSITLGTLKDPILMWAGDVNQDNIINMSDVIGIAKSFGVTSKDPGFNIAADFNCDKIINMSDVIIICKHFNKASEDYSSDTSENVKIKLNIINDSNTKGGGEVSISTISNDGTEKLGFIFDSSKRSLKFPFSKGTQVTLNAKTWGSEGFSCNISGAYSSENPLVFTAQGGEEITYYFYAKDPTPTPTPSITPPPGQTPTPTSPYPLLHKGTCHISSKFSASDITKNSAIISTVINVSYGYKSDNAALVYWKKDTPEDKSSRLIKLGYDNEASNSQLTGLEPNTTYCCQVEMRASPNGELQTGNFTYKYVICPDEPYTTGIFEFSTLP